jgi:hypothetical protein
MAYRSTIKQYPTYIHVTGAGANSKESVRQFLIDAYRASVERKCRSLLLEMSFSGPSLGLGSIYSVIAERSLEGSMLERIAYVDANSEHALDAAEFAELAAKNQGVNVRLFRSRSEAERWLQDVGSKK